MATVSYPHLTENADGVPILEGTRVKVVMIVRDRLAGLDAEAIQRLYPDLTLGQIHSALASYYVHQAELDEDIARRDCRVEELRAATEDSPTRRKLRSQGLIP